MTHRSLLMPCPELYSPRWCSTSYPSCTMLLEFSLRASARHQGHREGSWVRTAHGYNRPPGRGAPWHPHGHRGAGRRGFTWWRWSSRWSTAPPAAPWACCRSRHPPGRASGTRGTCSAPPGAAVWFCRASSDPRWPSGTPRGPSSGGRRCPASWTSSGRPKPAPPQAPRSGEGRCEGLRPELPLHAPSDTAVRRAIGTSSFGQQTLLTANRRRETPLPFAPPAAGAGIPRWNGARGGRRRQRPQRAAGGV